MKKRLPAIVTALLIVTAVVYFAQRKQSPVSKVAEASPEDVIWQMMDATRAGNVQAYLRCFTGALKQNLEKSVSEMGEPQFSGYLKRLNDEVTGVAVSDLERANDAEASVKVEFVFRSKNEAQKHHLRLIEKSWKIDQVDGAERIKTLIPYGTAVSDQE